MGGKQKQAHRTKGNVRPSSSARAAELLASSAQSGSGFVGFGALSGDLGYVPASGVLGSDDTDSSVNADFRMVLRKLSKRDATTKLKAVQEFGALCQEKTVDDVNGILPYWPRLYNKLAMDNDRRVREATQESFEQMVLRVRRNLAPHLKGIMGTWLMSMCDLYAPAASAAKKAFLAAFPPNKQADAITFCKDEILTNFTDNLYVQTPGTLSDPKTTPAEDMESKYQRVLCTSLLGFSLFLTSVPATTHDELHSSYAVFLDNSKTWKFAKSSNMSVKGSFYAWIATLCQTNPKLANAYADKLCPVVLHNLDEMDPGVCGTIWQAALHLLSVIEDCWQHVNPRKAVFPKLWNVLKSGGSGSATVIYPNLLPMLSKIPPDVIGKGVAFYQEYFTHMKTGLSTEKVQCSPSECSAIVRSMVECARYSMVQSMETPDPKVADFILIDQVLPLIEASFVDKSAALSNSSLNSLIVDLLEYLHSQSKVCENSNTKTNCEKLLESFWVAMETICETQIEHVDSDQSYLLQRVGAFLESFRSPQTSNKKMAKVKFTDSAEEQIPAAVHPDCAKLQDFEGSFEKGENAKQSELLNVEGKFIKLVCKLCGRSFAIGREKNSDLHVKFLANVAYRYPSSHLYRTILKTLDIEMINEKDAAHDLYKQVLLPWLLDIEQDSLNENRKSMKEGVISFICSVILSVPARLKMDFLDEFSCKSRKSSSLYALLEKVLTDWNLTEVQPWFRSQTFGQKMVAVTEELCRLSLAEENGESEEMSSKWSLLTLALSSNKQFEPMLCPNYVDKILTQIQRALPSASERMSLQPVDLERVIAFVCDVAHNFFSNVKGCILIPASEELLLAVFQVDVQHGRTLSEKVKEKVTSSWQMGVKALITQQGGLMKQDGFLSQVSIFIKENVGKCSTLERLNDLCETSLSVAKTMSATLPALGDSTACAEQMNLTVKTWLDSLHQTFPDCPDLPQWCEGPVLAGDLIYATCPDMTNPASLNNLPQFICSVVFSTRIHVAMVTADIPEEDANVEPMKTESRGIDNLVSVFYALAFCQGVIGERTEMLSTTELCRVYKQLLKDAGKMVKSLSTSDLQEALCELFTRSTSHGELWALALKSFLELVRAVEGRVVDVMSVIGSLDRYTVLTQPDLHTVLAVVDFLPPVELDHMIQLVCAQMMSCQADQILQINGCLGYLSIINTAVRCQDVPLRQDGVMTSDLLTGILEVLMGWRDHNDNLFVFDSSVSEADWSVVAVNVEVMSFIGSLLHHMSTRLTANQWDFIMCAAVAWTQTCTTCDEAVGGGPVGQCFATRCFRLLTDVATCMAHVVPSQPESFPSNLLTEWHDFFSESIYDSILPFFVTVVKQVKVESVSLCEDLLLKQTGSAVSLCPADHTLSHKLPAKLKANQNSHLPDSLQSLLNHLCPLLIHPIRAVQLTAYRLLLQIIEKLPSYDEGKEKEEEEESRMCPPAALMSVLTTSMAAVQMTLADLQMGENMVIEPYIEEHAFAFGYLLSWQLLLVFFKAASAELRAEYASYLKHHEFVQQFLVNLFLLMPKCPVVQLKDRLVTPGPGQKLTGSWNMFTDQPLLDITGVSSSQELQHLACMVYYRTLEDLPAVVRQWWSDQDKRTSGIVDEFTTKYVSPILCSQEVNSVQGKDHMLNSMTVRARPAAREVVATYSVDEVTMELVITLPVNYPLGSINVESGRRVGVANAQWRNWMLQMTTYLAHQNGSIIDGLSLWKRNVDKRFEGVEDCMICFSVLHGSTCQLPKLQCKTCKKKFHSACLYKWFNTSSKSTCPLCRNLF